MSGLVDLGSMQGESSRASVISADGGVIAGWEDQPISLPIIGGTPRRGAMWWQGLERLLHPYGWAGEATATNFNGTCIAGYGHPNATAHGYLWTPWGQLEDLGTLKRGLPSQQEQEDRSVAPAVSDNCSVVVGLSGRQPPTDAMIWTPETKMVKFSDYLKDKGIAVPTDLTLLVANSISPDGKFIAGVALNAGGAFEGWIVRLP